MGIDIAAQGRLEHRGQRARMIERILAIASEHFGPLAGPPLSNDEAGSILLCPASDGMMLGIGEDGTVELGCRTSPVGPGFHREVCRLLDAIADEGVEWTTVEDETGYYASRDDAALAQRFNSWLGELAKQLVQADHVEDSSILVCMDISTHFTAPAEYIAPFGPLTRQDLATIAASPGESGWMPWPLEVSHATLFLRAALCVLWCDVRWRPVLSEEEDEEGVDAEPRGAAAHALTLLDAAFEADPELDYPWHEWTELAELNGWESAGASEAQSRAAVTPEPQQPVGYRRHDVSIEAPACRVRIPGSSAWTFDDGVMTIYDGERTMKISGFHASPEEAGDAATVLENAWEGYTPEGDQIGDLIEWKSDDAMGRVRLARSIEDEVIESIGIVAGPKCFCFVSIYFHDEDLTEDVLSTYRAITPDENDGPDDEQE